MALESQAEKLAWLYLQLGGRARLRAPAWELGLFVWFKLLTQTSREGTWAFSLTSPEARWKERRVKVADCRSVVKHLKWRQTLHSIPLMVFKWVIIDLPQILESLLPFLELAKNVPQLWNPTWNAVFLNTSTVWTRCFQ